MGLCMNMPNGGPECIGLVGDHCPVMAGCCGGNCGVEGADSAWALPLARLLLLGRRRCR